MTAPLLDARNISRRFVAGRTLLGRPNRWVNAVDDVSLVISRGETLALVGESGCGKSTLGRLVMRLIDPDAGSIRLSGEDITTLSDRAMRPLRRRVQLVFQDPFAALNPRMQVGEMIAEPLMLHNLVPPAGRAARVAELLAQVGLSPSHADRFAHEFSGGQRQRIVIARALAAEPELIVCDEPVSALDVSIRSQILNLLAGLRERLGLSFLFISHDLSVVRHIADRVAVMYLGRIVEEGPTAEIFADPRHPYTRALIAAIPLPEPGARPPVKPIEGDLPSPNAPPPGCHFNTRCPHVADICRSERPALISGAGPHPAACHFRDGLPPAGAILPHPRQRDPRLEALLAAFAPKDQPGETAP
jgi:oligopeptide/dipeptide ABC transporter ATP-binding protein